jgi:hypothetical protein
MAPGMRMSVGSAPATYPAAVSDSLEHVQSALREYREASAHARAVMLDVEETLLEGGKQLDNGMAVLDALFSVPVSKQREEMQGVLDRFHTARHHVRLLMVAECVASGMNARQISEMWGFSRQRAHLLIQEAVAYASSLEGE